MTIYTIRKYVTVLLKKDLIKKHLLSKVSDARDISIVIDKFHRVYSVFVYFVSDIDIPQVIDCLPPQIVMYALKERDKLNLKMNIRIIEQSIKEMNNSISNEEREIKRIKQALDGGNETRSFQSKGDPIT